MNTRTRPTARRRTRIRCAATALTLAVLTPAPLAVAAPARAASAHSAPAQAAPAPTVRNADHCKAYLAMKKYRVGKKAQAACAAGARKGGGPKCRSSLKKLNVWTAHRNEACRLALKPKPRP